MVPWLFKDGLSSWASTSSELLGSLVALHILKRDFGHLLRGPGLLRTTFTGGTDNQAAEALSLKLLTTRVPLMFVVMQYVMDCDTMGVRCQLSWRPRGANEDADKITKNQLDGFDDSLRIPVTWDEINLDVLTPLLGYCNFGETLGASKLDSETSERPVAIRFEKSVWG